MDIAFADSVRFKGGKGFKKRRKNKCSGMYQHVPWIKIENLRYSRKNFHKKEDRLE